MNDNNDLTLALEGDIHAFQRLFGAFQPELKSYLYRLLANRADAEDLAHDTFIRAYDRLVQFRGESSLKTWIFQIATNLARNELRHRRRWTPDVSQQAKELVLADPELRSEIERTVATSPAARYEIREHINTCFTCITKNLLVENQVALLLKDIYDFTVPEIMAILELSEGTVKYLIQTARRTLTEIFHERCALVNKKGVCHQCSELNGWFNPAQNRQAELVRIKMVRDSQKYDRKQLFALRTALVREIDPLRGAGHELQEVLLRCNRLAMGEQ